MRLFAALFVMNEETRLLLDITGMAATGVEGKARVRALGMFWLGVEGR